MKLFTTTTMSKLACSFIMLMALVGCAAQLAFREGKELMVQNKIEEGLEKLKFASVESPDNLEFRRVYLLEKERSIYALNEKADKAIQLENFSQAQTLYLELLKIDRNNDQAVKGLKKIDQYNLHNELIIEAKNAIDKKEVNKARRLLSEVITGNPNNSVAQQLLKTIVVELPEKSTQESALNNSYKKTVNLDFKDAPLRQIFEIISRNSGLNFIFDKDVKTDQRTSLQLKNSTIESAINFVLLTNQLEKQVLDGNTLLIYPNTVSKQKDYQEMIVKSFFLTNADAKTVVNTLKTIIKTRDIVVDEKLNMIIMRDNPEAIKMAEKLVAFHDVAEPEVMLEVEILEVKRTRLLDLGIQWPNSLSLTPLSTTQGSVLNLRDLRDNINSTSLAAGIGPVTVKARKENGDANLLANPRIRAKNHEKAHFLIGERVPNITTTATSTGFVSESINYIDVGLKLDIEPTVYLDNDVGIKVALEVSSITNQLKTQSGSVAYQIGTRNANTVLRLKNGETQILAGLINDEERKSANKVPLLGELPIIGRLFGSHVDDNQKTEIILSITPHLIRNIQAPEYRATSFSSGTEASLRLREGSASPSLVNEFSQSNEKETKNIETPQAIGSGNNQTGQGSLNSANGSGFGSMNGVVNNGVGAPQLNWQGPRQVKVGDTFSMQLIMQSDQPMTSAPLSIGFNAQVLQVVSVNEGIFMRQGGAQTNFSHQIDPKGIITMTNARTVGGASSPGGFATIVFRALAPIETTPLQVLSFAPLGLNGKALNTAQLQTLPIEIQP